MSKARLNETYTKSIRPALQKKLGLANIMQVPKISKIVINVGVKEAVGDNRALQTVSQVIGNIAGQMPVRTAARKSIAGFKIREGMQLGIMVTLRRERMYDFLDKLINLALPKVRDFQGVPTRLDGQGNYNLGIKDWTIFPEAESLTSEKLHGLNITIQTTADNDAAALELLKSLGMPFRKQNS